VRNHRQKVGLSHLCACVKYSIESIISLRIYIHTCSININPPFFSVPNFGICNSQQNVPFVEVEW
jgi:hypothetical protein